MKPSTYTSSTHQEGYKIIQSHLTINCNLKSNSDAPDSEALKQFLDTAIKEGYNTLNVSGNEPFHYQGLKELLKFTKEAGYYNSVTSYGNLFNNDQNHEVLRYISLVLVSLHGKKEEHNRIKKNDFAFDQMLWELAILKENQAPFGFVHLLHNEPVDTLKWICDFAKEQQAKLVHLHPTEKAASEKANLNSMVLPDELRHKFFVLYHFYKLKHQDDFDLQLDLLHRNIVLQYPQLAYQFVCEDICDTNFYRELNIDEEGYILPVSFGFPKQLALGNIYEHISLKEMMDRFHVEKLNQLKNIYLKVYQNIVDNPNNLLFNYADLVLNESRGFGHAYPDKAFQQSYGVC